jgi:hypothetical protein
VEAATALVVEVGKAVKVEVVMTSIGVGVKDGVVDVLVEVVDDEELVKFTVEIVLDLS